MSLRFTAGEVIELAILIEANGEAFYRSLEGTAPDVQTREVFAYLAGEEERHRAAFAEMKEALATYRPVESYPGEHAAYMEALAEGNVFTKRDAGRELAQRIITPHEAVEMALEFEKESILFFEGMRRFLPRESQETVDQLIAEEKKHIVRLKELEETLGM
jgi:rubrerythrin